MTGQEDAEQTSTMNWSVKVRTCYSSAIINPFFGRRGNDVDLDFDLDRIIATLAPHSDMMAFVLDGRLDPLAEVFGLVHYDSVPAEQVARFRALLRDLDESNAEIGPVRARIAGQLPLARSGSQTLQLRRADAWVDRLYQRNTRLAELITKFLAL